MSSNNKGAPAKTAAEICAKFKLSEPAAKLLRPDMQARPFLDSLIDQEHFADAVRFLAHSMPKREAMWWACLCTRPEKGAVLPPEAAAAHKAAEDWVCKPSDEKRRAAFAAGEVEDMPPPIKLTCTAIFFSEGSLAPAGLPPVPPADHLGATTAANAIIVAAVAEPPKIAAKYKQYLALGQDVAAGKNRWKEEPPKK
jgi:hypothetical protein